MLATNRHSFVIVLAISFESVASCSALAAQVIRVAEDVPVAIGLERRSLVEPHFAIHPTNPDHFLGATIVTAGAETFEERASRQTCTSFVSTDGGANWQRHDFPLTWCFDPWVAITTDGHAVFTALAAHPSFPHERRGGLIVYHSADGRRTWDEQPVGLGLQRDSARRGPTGAKRNTVRVS